ncbi:hypothetical protein BGW36DRAFT_183103 [Talaromyces proteolyticus]|uniref:Uncharacterized protein n=1 Tax=Talaromyces proteolyticus TaxID=1131652 RepID=A0AAD4KUB8_9EURO|nr:uncharacterized protein BGW36DRAFT_183103 [Talaromyces proteolyticus]KAH8696209.1 hypothetical protein BGW36DRAFT_183103 [Talaromyces proteolyticus]
MMLLSVRLCIVFFSFMAACFGIPYTPSILFASLFASALGLHILRIFFLVIVHFLYVKRRISKIKVENTTKLNGFDFVLFLFYLFDFSLSTKPAIEDNSIYWGTARRSLELLTENFSFYILDAFFLLFSFFLDTGELIFCMSSKNYKTISYISNPYGQTSM